MKWLKHLAVWPVCLCGGALSHLGAWASRLGRHRASARLWSWELLMVYYYEALVPPEERP